VIKSERMLKRLIFWIGFWLLILLNLVYGETHIEGRPSAKVTSESYIKRRVISAS
jgi:hypothetical protein